MKKSLLWLLAIFFIIIIGSYSVVRMFGTRDEAKDKHTIVASFYPEYVILLNLLDNCEDINVENITSSSTGCLHDYQLTSSDMKLLEHSDGLVINGGGMEPFLDNVTSAYPKLNIIDSSKGIKLLKNISTYEHTHSDQDEQTDNKDHGHNNDDSNNDKNHDHNNDDSNDAKNNNDKHNHGEYNAHIWLNPTNYLSQINTITKALCNLYPDYKDTIKKNSATYTNEIKKIQHDIEKLNKKIKKQKKKDIIIFHDSFAYIADSFNFDVIQCIEIDSDSSLSAGTIASTIDEINAHDIEILLSEKQFKTTIADNIAKETDAKVYVLDSLVTGDNVKDSYINGMKKNIASIENIFK